jgi:hypothetical protein
MTHPAAFRRVVWATTSIVAGATVSTADAATATFTPLGPTQVEIGADMVFEVTVAVTGLSGFNTADVIIGANNVTDLTFAYSAAWLSAFASVTTPQYDIGFYQQSVFVGGNHPTSVGASLQLGSVTIHTACLPPGDYRIDISNASDGFSTLGLNGQPEPLNGFATFAVVGPPSCTVAAPPEVTQFDSNAGTGVTLVDLKMNRYLGIRVPCSAGREQAVRVEFRNLPASFNLWNGRQLWVTDVVQRCETGGSDGTTTCVHPFFPQAGLSCTPFFRDWTTVPGGTVYVTHPGIIPGQTTEYEIKVIDRLCDVNLPANYSVGKTVLQTRFGDVVGPFDTSGGYYLAPEGANVGIGTDVTAVLAKFANRGTAPIKARSDLEPCELDYKINISDVTEALNAFRNLPYRFALGSGNCTNPDPCSYAPTTEMAAGD